MKEYLPRIKPLGSGALACLATARAHIAAGRYKEYFTRVSNAKTIM